MIRKAKGCGFNASINSKISQGGLLSLPNQNLWYLQENNISLSKKTFYCNRNAISDLSKRVGKILLQKSLKIKTNKIIIKHIIK